MFSSSIPTFFPMAFPTPFPTASLASVTPWTATAPSATSWFSTGWTDPIAITLLMVAVAALAGTTVQSLSGSGFGMVSVPIFTLAIGPSGVLLANMAGIFTAGSLAVAKRKEVEWKTALLLVLGSFPSIALVIWLLAGLRSDWVNLIIGSVMGFMVLFSLTAKHFRRFQPSILTKILTGFGAGALSATVAQSGPLMTAYAQATRWEQSAFSATMQPYLFIINCSVVFGKLNAHFDQPFFHNPLILAAALMGVLGGMGLGRLLEKQVRPQSMRSLAIAIASFGAALITAKAIYQLFWLPFFS